MNFKADNSLKVSINGGIYSHFFLPCLILLHITLSKSRPFRLIRQWERATRLGDAAPMNPALLSPKPSLLLAHPLVDRAMMLAPAHNR